MAPERHPLTLPACGSGPDQACFVPDALPHRSASQRSARCLFRQCGIARRRHRAHWHSPPL